MPRGSGIDEGVKGGLAGGSSRWEGDFCRDLSSLLAGSHSLGSGVESPEPFIFKSKGGCLFLQKKKRANFYLEMSQSLFSSDAESSSYAEFRTLIQAELSGQQETQAKYALDLWGHNVSSLVSMPEASTK